MTTKYYCDICECEIDKEMRSREKKLIVRIGRLNVQIDLEVGQHQGEGLVMNHLDTCDNCYFGIVAEACDPNREFVVNKLPPGCAPTLEPRR